VGWAVGEVVALSIVLTGAWSLVTGRPFGSGDDPVTLAVALPVGLFLLLWLTFWTFGGFLAGRELLRVLFGRDRLVVRHDGLEIERSFGLFRSLKQLPREEIRRFYSTSARAALSAETTHGTIVLTRLGAPAERAELEEALNKEFNVPAQAASADAAALPKGWCEEQSLEHEPVLVKDPAIRRKQARIAWIACACLSLLPVYLLSVDRERPDLLASVIVSFVLIAAMAGGACCLSFARKEWRLDRGRLVLQGRFGQNRKQLFEAVSLELIEDISGDHGPRYVLQAAASGAPPQTGWHRAGLQRRTIYSQSDDPAVPHGLGLWLSQRCELRFLDLTTAEAKVKNMEDLKTQLANSGRFGRAALRVIERVEKLKPGGGAAPNNS